MANSQEEQAHWKSVLKAYDGYMQYHLSANNARRKAFLSLPRESREMLDSIGYREKLEAVDEGIRQNSEFIDEMIADPVFADMLQDNTNLYDPSKANEPSTYDDHQTEHGQAHDHSHTPLHSHDRPHLHPQSHDHTHAHAHAHALAHAHDHSHTHSHHLPQFPNPSSSSPINPKRDDRHTPQEKIRSTLRSIVRDWSSDGAHERKEAYDPCLQALERYFPSEDMETASTSVGVQGADGSSNKRHRRVRDRRDVKVLVPGCGLARLAMEIAARGFTSQANEFSAYMLIASNFILNQTSSPNSHVIFPYLHSFSNHLTTEHHLLRSVSIPDVCPADVLGEGKGGDFSLVAGDFEEIYGSHMEASIQDPDGEDGDEGHKGKWGAVVTCFFIDCARNVLSYLRIIHDLLEEDGVWINIGPLLWHFENSPSSSNKGEGSIELSMDEVKELAKLVGFDFHDEMVVSTTYTGVPDSMLKHEYQAAFWTATKRKI